MTNATTEPSKKTKPNVVFIFADDLGYADLSCYGGNVAHYLVHTPYAPNERFIREEDKVDADDPVKACLYPAMLRELDWHVGEVMTKLKKLGIDDNTVVFFTSDNGPTRKGSAGILRGGKFDTVEGGHRVPSIVRCPGWVRQGVSCDAMSPSTTRMLCRNSLPSLKPPETNWQTGIVLAKNNAPLTAPAVWTSKSPSGTRTRNR